ncbi:hypothetical protein ABIA33_003567 [Streptacidiphilus sp. MAP12-16]|uniref:hypothetical protein n=1 Tax=Streptacidiphilus sp. MAP12-16 TaxID=3156300 RepID=UPI0035123C44
MSDEEMLRRALQDEATGLEPSPWSARAGEVRGRVRRRRRRIRRAVGLGLVLPAALAAAVVGVLLWGSGGGGPVTRVAPMTAPTVTATRTQHSAKPTASLAASPTGAWPSVRVVQSGRTVDFGHGMWMTLTAGQRCAGLGQPGGSTCKSVTDGNQGPGTVSQQIMGDQSGTMYTPLYIGSGQVARMTVEVGGTTYRATVVTLPGRPGYATGYVWGPPISGGLAGISPKITVYDAQGQVLAVS